jgi:GNAT superfamily N-acetyltransferase
MAATPEFHSRPRLAIRPLAPSDRPALERAFAALSPESRYNRFHTPLQRLPPWLARALTEIDGVDHVALVGVEQRDSAPNGRGVGIARFMRSREARELAELAVTVIDRAQGRGIARMLVTELAKIARTRGIQTFTMMILHSNRRARMMAGRLGAVAKNNDAGVVTYHLPITAFERRSREMQRLTWA